MSPLILALTAVHWSVVGHPSPSPWRVVALYLTRRVDWQTAGPARRTRPRRTVREWTFSILLDLNWAQLSRDCGSLFCSVLYKLWLMRWNFLVLMSDITGSHSYRRHYSYPMFFCCSAITFIQYLLLLSPVFGITAKKTERSFNPCVVTACIHALQKSWVDLT